MSETQKTTDYTPDPEQAAYDEKSQAAWNEVEAYFNSQDENQENPSSRLAEMFFEIYLTRRPHNIASQAAHEAFVMWANAGDSGQRVEAAIAQIGDDLETLAGVAPMYIEIYKHDHGDAEVDALCESLLEQLGTDERRSGLLYSMAFNWKWNGEYDKVRKACERILAMNASDDYVRQARSLIYEMENLNIGQMAPVFEANDINGNPISLAGLRGKAVLIDFWATWCGPCIGEFPHLKRVHEKFAGDRFIMLSISLDDDCEAARNMIEKEKLAWLHVCEGEWDGSKIAQLYNVMGIPAIFLIGPDGKIVAKQLREHGLDKAIGELLDVEKSS